MSCLEVIVLEQFLVLQVAVLSLKGIELVSEGEVVLVSLLNLEDLGLELGDEEVLLVASQVHTIVVLHHTRAKAQKVSHTGNSSSTR